MTLLPLALDKTQTLSELSNEVATLRIPLLVGETRPSRSEESSPDQRWPEQMLQGGSRRNHSFVASAEQPVVKVVEGLALRLPGLEQAWAGGSEAMAMGRRRRRQQGSLWVETSRLAQSGGHPFYERLNRVLENAGFDAFVEEQCGRFYAGKVGRPSLAPAVYFRLLLIGYFEGIDSERGIAWRVGDSLGLRRAARSRFLSSCSVAAPPGARATRRRFQPRGSPAPLSALHRPGHRIRGRPPAAWQVRPQDQVGRPLPRSELGSPTTQREDPARVAVSQVHR